VRGLREGEHQLSRAHVEDHAPSDLRAGASHVLSGGLQAARLPVRAKHAGSAVGVRRNGFLHVLDGLRGKAVIVLLFMYLLSRPGGGRSQSISEMIRDEQTTAVSCAKRKCLVDCLCICICVGIK